MKMRAMVLGLLACVLTSCVAFVVAGAAGGLMVYDRRSVVMLERDARIFHLIHTAIATDPRFYGSRVKVSSFQQVVLLLGQVPSAAARSWVQKIAQNTPNVKRVYNHITLSAPLTLAEQSQDTWITGQVRSRMLAEKGLESGSIQVNTEQGVVYLTGIVAPEQADLAVSVARTVNGVRQVVKMFQYIR